MYFGHNFYCLTTNYYFGLISIIWTFLLLANENSFTFTFNALSTTDRAKTFRGADDDLSLLIYLHLLFVVTPRDGLESITQKHLHMPFVRLKMTKVLMKY